MDILEDNDKLNEMYRLYGIAAHNCSNIEYRIAYLLLGPKWKKIEANTPEKVQEVYDDLYSKPLGTLLKLYQHHFDFSEKTISQMKDILDKRNHLIHRFFGSYGKNMKHIEVVDQMISGLENLVVLFQAASHSLDPENWRKV
jgi:hypothetical protein